MNRRTFLAALALSPTALVQQSAAVVNPTPNVAVNITSWNGIKLYGSVQEVLRAIKAEVEAYESKAGPT